VVAYRVEAARASDAERWHVEEWAPPPPADTWVQTEWSYVRWARAPTARMAAAFPHDAALQATLSSTTATTTAAAGAAAGASAALAPSRVRQEGLTKVMQHAGVQTDWDAADVELGRLENMDWGGFGGLSPIGDDSDDDDNAHVQQEDEDEFGRVVAAERLDRIAPMARPLPPPRNPAAARAASFLALSAKVRTQLEGAMKEVLGRSMDVGLGPRFLWKDGDEGEGRQGSASAGQSQAAVEEPAEAAVEEVEAGNDKLLDEEDRWRVRQMAQALVDSRLASASPPDEEEAEKEVEVHEEDRWRKQVFEEEELNERRRRKKEKKGRRRAEKAEGTAAPAEEGRSEELEKAERRRQKKEKKKRAAVSGDGE